MKTSCDSVRAALAQRTLDPDTATAVAAHVAACAHCRELGVRYERAVVALREAPPRQAPPPFEAVRLAARARLGGGASEASKPGWRAWLGPWRLGIGVAALALIAVVIAFGAGTGVGDGPIASGAETARATPSPEATGPAAGGDAGDRRTAGGAHGGTAVLTLVRASGAAGLEKNGVRTAVAETGDGAVAVPVGATLTTTSGELGLADPTTASLTLATGSRMQIAAWDPHAAVVRLESGTVTCAVEKRHADERFEVHTADAIVRVVGTRFAVAVDPSGTRVETFEGRVRVERPDGTLVGMVAAGEALRVAGTTSHAEAALHEVAAAPAPEVLAPAEPAGPEVLPVNPTPLPDTRPQAPPRAPRSPQATQAVHAPPPLAPLAPPTPPAPVREDEPTLLARARGLVAAHHYEEAVAFLTARLAEPNAPRARLLALLGDAQRFAGAFAEARASYEASLATDGAPRGVITDLVALLEHDLHLPAEAARAWRDYLARHPQDPRAPEGLALEARVAASDPPAAERALRRLVADYPGSLEATTAVLTLGRQLLGASRWGEAATWFEPWLEAADPTRAEAALVGLMRARLGLGQRDAVRALADRYARRFPQGTRQAEVARLVGALGIRD